MNKLALLLTILFILPSAGHAFMQPSEQLNDPILEKEAQSIYSSLRCVVCQGQTIAGSDSEIAQAMRNTVRQRLLEGENKDQVLAYMRNLYGDEVLSAPPLESHTVYLWAIPLLVFIIGGFLVFQKTLKQQVRHDNN